MKASGGVDKDVTFVAEADAAINHRIDAAYPHEVPTPRGTLCRSHGGISGASHDDQACAALVLRAGN
jgi:hypothetical protein